MQDIRYGAILHDVGKLSVPDAILRKAGPLTAEEWQVIRRHTIAGARILAPVARMSRAAEIVRYHHERWDGTGYREGLRGEAIPLGGADRCRSRCLYCDERPYRKALTLDKALEELQHDVGTQFDPRRSCGIPTRSEEWRIPLMAEASLWLRYAHFADCV